MLCVKIGFARQQTDARAYSYTKYLFSVRSVARCTSGFRLPARMTVVFSFFYGEIVDLIRMFGFTEISPKFE